MTILAETVDKQFTSLGAVLLIIGLVFVVGGITILCTEGFDLPFFLISILFIGSVMLCCAIFVCREPHKQLKVMLSDDYPATKLIDNYDIEYEDGKILVITEKAILEEEEDKK